MIMVRAIISRLCFVGQAQVRSAKSTRVFLLINTGCETRCVIPIRTERISGISWAEFYRGQTPGFQEDDTTPHTEGAVAGAITGAIIDVAVATTIASGGSNLVVMGVAVAAGTVGGAVGAVGGDVAGQVVEQRNRGNISISTDNFAEKATIGAVTGAIDGLSGGAFGIVGKTATASTKALQGTMSSNIATTATALTGQGATQATVNSAVNGITKGMGAAGVNTANSMLKVEAAASTATEVTAKVVEEQIKKKRK